MSECGKETNTRIYFFRGSGWHTLQLPNLVCFPSSNIFFKCFLVIGVYFFLIHVRIISAYLSINLQDLHYARKCSVHKSLLRETYVGNYRKWWALWVISSLSCWNLCGHGLDIYLNNLRSIYLLLNMVEATGTGTFLYTLTHSPNCLRSTIFTFKQSNSSRIRPLVLKLHAATTLPPLSITHASVTSQWSHITRDYMWRKLSQRSASGGK